MRPRVHTEKHLLQNSLFTVAASAIFNRTIAVAVSSPASASGIDVREGCTISAVYCEMWIHTDDATSGTAVITLEKVESQAPLMLAADSAALNNYDNKKNIFYSQVGLTPNNITYPMAAIKGWFKIPKGKQRFSLNDRIVLNILAQSNGLNACGMFIFKEQY